MTPPRSSLPPDVMAAFERGQPIDAIRLLLRQRAESLGRGAAPTPPRRAPEAPPAAPKPAPEPLWRGELAPGEVPRHSASLWDWVMVALLAYLGWRLLSG